MAAITEAPRKKTAKYKSGDDEEGNKLAKFWLDQIDQVDQIQKPWVQRGDTITKRFRDERNRADAENRRRLNLLWANIKILMPALYGKPPIPYVEREFLQKDPTARLASQMLEGTLKNEIKVNGLHSSVRRAVLDYLLPGRGVVWARYEPDVGEVGDSIPVEAQGSFEDDLAKIEGGIEKDSDQKAEALENTGEQLLGEQIPVDYVYWKDFYMFPAIARTWDEVQAIGKRVNISREEAIQRFGAKIGKALPYSNTQNSQVRKVPYAETAIFQQQQQRSIEVFEIWNKLDRKVYWVATGYDHLCDVKDDPLELVKFFPVPTPLSATLTNESMVPVPDYIEYQDQALQIDELTQRLAMLTKACKIAGCYDASNTSLKRLLQEGFENDLVPVDAWATFAEKGGVQGGIALLPIEEIQKVIETLTKVRQQLMIDLDTVTGISDIVRGTTDSRETLGGIRLKNNNAGTRLSDRQNEVNQFVVETLNIVGEIAAKYFSDKKLVESSNILYNEDLQPETILEELEPPPQPNAQQQNAPQNPQGNPQPQNPSPQAPGQPPFPQQPPQMQQPIFQGGINSLQPPQDNNVLQFPNLNPKAPPALNSPLGTPPQQPFFDIAPQIDPLDIITERVEKAIELLRKDVPRMYRIAIETDSTIFGDAAQERQDAAQFIGEVSKYLAGAAQLGMQLPEAVPALAQTLLWGIRKFRVGRSIEASFDDFVNKVTKRVKDQAKNPKPSPEEQKAQADLEATRIETQAKQAELQITHQHLKETNAMEMQKQQMEAKQSAEESRMNMELKQQEHQMKLKEMQMKHDLEMAKMQMELKKMQAELQMQGQQHQMQMEQDATMHQHTMEQNDQQHQQTIQQTQMQGEQQREQHEQTLEQTELKGQQAEQQHEQKIQQTQMAGKQQEAKHKQTMQQAKIKKTAGAKK